MAEVRKHRPRTSSIGDQVRAKVDSGPRPLTPGERYDPDFDPFFSEEPNQSARDSRDRQRRRGERHHRLVHVRYGRADSGCYF